MGEVEFELPVADDFLDPRSRDLDEHHAVQMFLGKTPEQAQEIFRQNFLFYQEDLTYMRAPAFRFYVVPAIAYLTGGSATGDSDAASTFCHVLESRLNADPGALAPIRSFIAGAIRQVLDRFDLYECDSEIYGEVPSRYRDLIRRLEG